MFLELFSRGISSLAHFRVKRNVKFNDTSSSKTAKLAKPI
jgi:hypothetical protein